MAVTLKVCSDSRVASVTYAVAKPRKCGRDQGNRGRVFAAGQGPASSLYYPGPRLICVVREYKNERSLGHGLWTHLSRSTQRTCEHTRDDLPLIERRNKRKKKP
eukprot:740941-Amphidinium_carterae.2